MRDRFCLLIFLTLYYLLFIKSDLFPHDFKLMFNLFGYFFFVMAALRDSWASSGLEERSVNTFLLFEWSKIRIVFSKSNLFDMFSLNLVVYVIFPGFLKVIDPTDDKWQ